MTNAAPPIRLGTRGSRLALIQAQAVAEALRAASADRAVEIVEVRTKGDRRPDAPIASLGVGAFTSTLERSLLDRRIDVAVHSLKDLPVALTRGLAIVPVLERADPRDVLINRWNATLLDLPTGARIGTSSPRREAQLRHGRPDVQVLPIRGNVETRIAKAEGGDYDGVVIAAAGVARLGLAERVAEYLSPHVMTPAPGQGALAVQVRDDDADLLETVRMLRHPATAAAVEAERRVLECAAAGCHAAIGAHTTVDGDTLSLFANVTAPDGAQSYRAQITAPFDSPHLAGDAAYDALLQQGAGALLT